MIAYTTLSKKQAKTKSFRLKLRSAFLIFIRWGRIVELWQLISSFR